MRKRISIKTRRPGLSPDAFRDHYENRHVPLGLGYVDRFQWRRYVRNYVVDVLGRPVAFDAYTEFWVDDDADDEALAQFVASPEFAALHEDDARFLDVEARFSCEVVTVPIEIAPEGSRNADATRGEAAEKVTLLWTSDGEATAESAAHASAITTALAGRVLDATLEQVLDPPPTAPFDTLLTLFLCDARAVDVPVDRLPMGSWSLLTLDPVETPADRLYGGASDTSDTYDTPDAHDTALARAPRSERKTG